MKHPFSKPPTTYAGQVALLKERGMVIEEPAQVEFYLQHLNYYRLRAYWFPFEVDHDSHEFRAGTRFSDVLNLYVFDRELRLLVLDAVERIEVSVRTQWAYQLAHRHGPHSHLDSEIARSHEVWERNIKALTEEVGRSHEKFIRHMQSKYSEILPPVWAVCEVMSLGQLSRWYANLKLTETRRAIAEVYGVDHGTLGSWLHHLTHVRNVCAHHSRLWNREFTITPKLPRHKPLELAEQCSNGSRRLYNSLVIMLYCMDVVAPQHHWRTRLKTLLADHDISVRRMGFPDEWEAMNIWSGTAADE